MIVFGLFIWSYFCHLLSLFSPFFMVDEASLYSHCDFHSYWVLTFKDDVWGVISVVAAIWEFFFFKRKKQKVQRNKMKSVYICNEFTCQLHEDRFTLFLTNCIYMNQWLDLVWNFTKNNCRLFFGTGVIWEITQIIMKNLSCTFWLFNFGSVFWPTKTI